MDIDILSPGFLAYAIPFTNFDIRLFTSALEFVKIDNVRRLVVFKCLPSALDADGRSNRINHQK